MQHKEDHFTGVAGRALFYQSWEPIDTPRGLLLIAHGAGEHSGRYQALAQLFCDGGFAVVAIDHNGHGKSEGRPGYVEAFEDYVQDFEQLRQLMSQRFVQVPMFLLGHSMGGLIAGNYLPDYQQHFVGCVLSGPLVRSMDEPGFVQRQLIQLLAVLLPRLGVLALDPANVSRDVDVVRRYAQDPLVFHGKMSTRMLRELFAGMKALQHNAERIVLPLFIQHGADDALTDPAGSQFLQETVGSQDKTLKIYPGLYHEIFNEPEGAAVMEDTLNWCEAHLPQA